METTTQIIKKEKANSYEFGKAGDRFKVYFEDAKDLKKIMNELREFGFITEVNNEETDIN